MWITDQDLDVETDARRPWGAEPSRDAATPQCECPDFCLVQHDNDN